METNKKIGAAECGDCNTCGKCGSLECPEGVTLYTMIIYSENFAGILNQITAVFTRRQVNIETLNVCASSTPGVHKYTITCYCTEEMAIMLTKQIEKKIDVLQANYFTDDELFILEACLLKLSTPIVLENDNVGKIIRKHGARVVEVNPTYSTVLLAGLTEDVTDLYDCLNNFGCLLQYSRSGRIAVTRSFDEPVSDYLYQQENKDDELTD